LTGNEGSVHVYDRSISKLSGSLMRQSHYNYSWDVSQLPASTQSGTPR
jgi:hypothetical protein